MMRTDKTRALENSAIYTWRQGHERRKVDYTTIGLAQPGKEFTDQGLKVCYKMALSKGNLWVYMQGTLSVGINKITG